MTEEVKMASAELSKFFDNLIAIKEFVKQKIDSNCSCETEVLKEIYNKLDATFKVQKDE